MIIFVAFNGPAGLLRGMRRKIIVKSPIMVIITYCSIDHLPIGRYSIGLYRSRGMETGGTDVQWNTGYSGIFRLAMSVTKIIHLFLALTTHTHGIYMR